MINLDEAGVGGGPAGGAPKGSGSCAPGPKGPPGIPGENGEAGQPGAAGINAISLAESSIKNIGISI